MSDVKANLDKNIFNTEKTDYEVPRLFFGQEQGLLDTLHRNYPKLWSLFKKLRKQDWDEEEFNFSECNEQFKTCPDHVYRRMINNLIWQWEGDTVAARMLAPLIAPFCSAVEVTVPYVRITDNEAVHALTYSDIIKGSFDNPDEVLNDLLAKVEPMQRLEVIGKIMSKFYTVSHKFALREIEETQELHNTLYMFLIAMYMLERIQFMVSFAETFDICRKGYFPPIRAAVEKIAMDEFEIHAQYGQEVLRLVFETPEGMNFYAQCREDIIKVVNEVYQSEMKFIAWNRVDGDYEGFMTRDEAEQWLKFNATAAAKFLGLQEDEVDFDYVTKNPIPWIKGHLNLSDNQASPQEEDSNAYMLNVIKRDDVNEKLLFEHPSKTMFNN